MLIYLEGPDGTGKTTLARELCRQQDAVYLHDTYRGRHQFAYTIGLIRRAWKLLQAGRPVVLDRSWVGDNVYSRVFRPGRQGTWVRWAHGLTEMLGAVTVLAVPANRERYLAEFSKLKGERPEMYSSMGGVYDAYRSLLLGDPADSADDYVGMLARRGGLGIRPYVKRYDRFGSDGEDILAAAGELWELASERAGQTRHQTPNLGSSDNWSGRQTYETILLVGEQTMHPTGAWPAPFLTNDHSSRYLARALTLAGVRQDDLCMVNARSPDYSFSGELERALRLPHRRVVCLGRVASQAVNYLGGSPQKVVLEHPQYRRRFKHHLIAEYAQQLKEACA